MELREEMFTEENCADPQVGDVILFLGHIPMNFMKIARITRLPEYSVLTLENRYYVSSPSTLVKFLPPLLLEIYRSQQ